MYKNRNKKNSTSSQNKFNMSQNIKHYIKEHEMEMERGMHSSFSGLRGHFFRCHCFQTIIFVLDFYNIF